MSVCLGSTGMRLILLIAVIALGIDALYFSGAYTQTAWRELGVKLEETAGEVKDRPILDPDGASSREDQTPDAKHAAATE